MSERSPESAYLACLEDGRYEELTPAEKKEYDFRQSVEFAKVGFNPLAGKQQVAAGVRNIMKAADEVGISIEITHSPDFHDCPFVIGDHQGPNEKEKQHGVDGVAYGNGGMETIFANPLLRQDSHIVLRGDIAAWVQKSLSKFVRASVFRACDPIRVQRSDDNKEQIRYRDEAFKRAFDVIDAEESCLVYPEGTRSRTGAILPFQKKLFKLCIERQVIPAVANDASVDIGVVAADTLRAFPYGQGMVPMYKAPVRIHGFRYDPERLLEKLRAEEFTPQRCREYVEDPRVRQECKTRITRVAKWLVDDMQHLMSESVCDLIEDLPVGEELTRVSV